MPQEVQREIERFCYVHDITVQFYRREETASWDIRVTRINRYSEQLNVYNIVITDALVRVVRNNSELVDFILVRIKRVFHIPETINDIPLIRALRRIAIENSLSFNIEYQDTIGFYFIFRAIGNRMSFGSAAIFVGNDSLTTEPQTEIYNYILFRLRTDNIIPT